MNNGANISKLTTDTNQKILLWLDDIRDPFSNYERKVPQTGEKSPYKIHWVKNYNEFTEWITKRGLPHTISFDHDLALEHYAPEDLWDDYQSSKMYQDQVSKNYVEKTGLDCAKWLIDYCINNNQLLPLIYVHSANPVGADNIKHLLNNFKKHCE